MSLEPGHDSSSVPDKKSRREELKKKWLVKRAAQQARTHSASSDSPLDKTIDTLLTPTYIAVGAAIIAFRKLTGKPSVTVKDFE
ncbi:MAG: hypothetical protein C4318_02685 [Acidimicrobiia bacterium]